jgi:hypothetical protein
LKRNVLFSINSDFAILESDVETRDRIERGSCYGFAGSQAESGVVPWAVDGFANNKPL